MLGTLGVFADLATGLPSDKARRVEAVMGLRCGPTRWHCLGCEAKGIKPFLPAILQAARHVSECQEFKEYAKAQDGARAAEPASAERLMEFCNVAQRVIAANADYEAAEVIWELVSRVAYLQDAKPDRP